ncbi:MAG: DUF1801 domain-containing protein [Flavobacteriaceae bacterium]
MNPAENYILKQAEPYQSIMLYVRSVLLKVLPDVTEHFSYKIPFYHYNKKPLCYFNILKGTHYVDVGFMDGVFLKECFPELVDGRQRKRVRSIKIDSLEEFDELRFVELLNASALFIDTIKNKKGSN